MPGCIRTIPYDIAELLGREGGVVTSAVAGAARVHPSRLRRLHRAGFLTRLSPGCYASSEAFAAASLWHRYRLRARAFAMSQKSPVFLTGWSAAVTWELPTMGVPPALPEAVRSKALRQYGERTCYGVVRAVEVPLGQARRRGRVRVMSREWAVAEVARTSPIPHALVVADAAAGAGADLHLAVGYMARWAGVHRARWVAEHADPLAESPIETLGRFTSIEFDLPMPVSNAWVGAERPEFRVDGLWPYHWVVSEADGAVKYDNRPDASRIVAKQGEREWRLRRLGLDVVRYGWDLAAHDRAELAGRFAALLRDSPARAQPIRWWKHVSGVGAVEPGPGDWPSPRPASIVLPAGWSG
ncbi:putative AbiEi antitoxin of type IV toxin-antitoxin system [Haloactinopolyspora alba]|uniref:Putative AbiEi antitoxin of type IV toxin-antitoxin system n=1 Tax=Haloactinopolyspora alba TaxID=648780 RepID=A0A2P8E138_9ACTN|nr:type IV toxin-antitoxin system AbiEi family antitoxin domain-containing protein [Haloactinopolyspora alba]PSL03159.1 putative AbiEi antitoxin of type IV toxin-antitoxin system [Haloactinopolyspora alba]